MFSFLKFECQVKVRYVCRVRLWLPSLAHRNPDLEAFWVISINWFTMYTPKNIHVVCSWTRWYFPVSEILRYSGANPGFLREGYQGGDVSLLFNQVSPKLDRKIEPAGALPNSLLTFNLSRPCTGGRGSSTADCVWTDKLKSSLEKLNFWFFSSSFFTIDFKICLYARHFDTSHCPHDIFWLHFANSSKLWENKMCQRTSFKFSAIKLFSESFGELTRCSQKMSCGQCEVSKRLAYRHILKSIVKKLEEKN